MKKPLPLHGKRIATRMLCYTLCFLSIIATRELLTSGDGPLNKFFGRGINQIMLASSKLGLGFALLCREETTRDTMIGRGSQKLGRAAHKAFIESSKVELFAE